MDVLVLVEYVTVGQSLCPLSLHASCFTYILFYLILSKNGNTHISQNSELFLWECKFFRSDHKVWHELDLPHKDEWKLHGKKTQVLPVRSVANQHNRPAINSTSVRLIMFNLCWGWRVLIQHRGDFLRLWFVLLLRCAALHCEAFHFLCPPPSQIFFVPPVIVHLMPDTDWQRAGPRQTLCVCVCVCARVCACMCVHACVCVWETTSARCQQCLLPCRRWRWYQEWCECDIMSQQGSKCAKRSGAGGCSRRESSCSY